MSLIGSFAKRARRLRKDQRGSIIVEFAYTLPIFTVLGFTGIELANMAVANMRVSQIAMTVADNLSRAKQSVPSALPQFREVDVNDAFLGAKIQGGNNIPILTNGRIVVTSLQQNASGKQTIAWQRCKGMRVVPVTYGVQGSTQPNSGTSGFQGMGPNASVKAEANSAIIFAEVTYTYVPLIASSIMGPTTIKKEAAYYVRDDRDLTGGPENNGVYNPNPVATKSTCNVYDATF